MNLNGNDIRKETEGDFDENNDIKHVIDTDKDYQD